AAGRGRGAVVGGRWIGVLAGPRGRVARRARAAGLRRVPRWCRALGGVAGAGDPARGGLRGLACRGPRQGGAARADRRLGARRVALDGAALRAHARRLGRPRLGGPARVPGGDATAGSADPLPVGNGGARRGPPSPPPRPGPPREPRPPPLTPPT